VYLDSLTLTSVAFVLDLKSASISSKLRPRVSGKYLITKIKAQTPIAAKIKKTCSTDKTSVKIGNNCATSKLPIDSTKAAIPVAAPRARVGGDFGNITQSTGPQVKPKKMMKSVRQATIIHAEDWIPTVQTNIAMINSEATIPIVPMTNNRLRSILSIIIIATIVIRTFTVPIPTVPNIEVASPRPALLNIVGA